MALLQISEPGMSTVPHQHRLAVGIDLGTTNSLVASVRSGVAEALPDVNGNLLLPSVVHYNEMNNVDVGKSALAYATSDPLNTIASVKRLLGRSVEEMDWVANHLPYEFDQSDPLMPAVVTRQGNKNPIEISAEILKVLKDRAEQTLGGELQGAVVTVPAYFDEAQRQATRDAARIAGLEVMRLINEPTAAAVAYGLDQTEEGVIVVYDLGGGTFDVSVLRLQKGVFEVIATGGDTALGGDDFDAVILEWVLQQLPGLDVSSHKLMRALSMQVREVKETLTNESECNFEVGIESPSKLTLTRVVFDELIHPLVKKTIRTCRKVLRDAEIDLDQVMDTVMVGGATRVPLVQEKVSEFFGREPKTEIDPDQVVAIGAALQANVLVGNSQDDQVLLLDVTPLSLGLETMGGLVEVIIPRNTTLPVARAQEFTTFKDGQTAMSIHVVQGERDLVNECRSLAHFELRGFPPMVAGAAKIRVSFQVDADGLLNVEAEEVSSNTRASVVVKPSYGLTDEQVETMLRASVEHADTDMRQRQLLEHRVEADRVIEAITAALKADQELLNESETAVIVAAVADLEQAKAGEDGDDITNAVEAVEQAAATFVARRMNASVREVMAGKAVAEFTEE